MTYVDRTSRKKNFKKEDEKMPILQIESYI